MEVFVLNNTPDALDLPDIGYGAQHAPAKRLQNERALGFGANQNKLMQQAAGRYYLPLNSDTIVQPGALQTLIAFMDAHPQCGIAGPKLIFPDGRLQPSCRNKPGIFASFFEASGLWTSFRGNRMIGTRFFMCSPHDTIMQPDWFSGACLIVRREAAQAVGLFDVAHLPGMYLEDTDWCLRMKRRGWQVCFVPNAVIVHLESQSPLDAGVMRLGKGNLFAFLDLHYSALHAWAIRMSMALAITLRLFKTSDADKRRYFQHFRTSLIAGRSVPHEH